MAVVFDTHTWVKRLKEAGFTEQQAEAEVNLVREALAANIKDLVTKDYLDTRLKDTEVDLAHIKADIAWLKWLTGAIALGMLAQLLKSFGVI